MEIRFRPTTSHDFILNLYSEAHGEHQLCFANEAEVYLEFERIERLFPLEAILLRLKQISLQMVQLMAIECDPWSSPAHAVFAKFFPGESWEAHSDLPTP